MRTTVTIDPDTEALLKEEVRRSGRSFKEVLNEAVQRALGRPTPRCVEVKPLFDRPFPAEFGGMSMNRLADLLDDEETLDSDFARFPGLDWRNPLIDHCGG